MSISLPIQFSFRIQHDGITHKIDLKVMESSEFLCTPFLYLALEDFVANKLIVANYEEQGLVGPWFLVVQL